MRRLAPLFAALLAACGGSAAPAPAHRHTAHHHGHAGPVGHRFEDADRWAKVFDDPERDAWQRPADVVATAGVAAGMTVVDLGAGTGYFVPHLARAVGDAGRVLALDVEPDMVRYLEERARREGLANVEARRVEADDPALGAASVDRVLVVNTWHHAPDRAAYAGRLRDALRPGGAIVVVDFTLESEMGPPRDHKLPPERVIADFAAAGLTAEVVTEDLPEQYVVIARRAD